MKCTGCPHLSMSSCKVVARPIVSLSDCPIGRWNSGFLTPEVSIAPSKGNWEGTLTKRPWQYNVTAVIPVLDTPDQLAICIEVLRLQTERPYIMVIDTGSVQHRDEIESFRASDCEIHYIRSHGWQHPSQPVSVAQQMAAELCRTEYMFSTHADCFLRRQGLLADWMALAKSHLVVAYRMTPRPYVGWETEVGHTAMMMHLPSMRKNGVSWNMNKYAEDNGTALFNQCMGMNRPDTETEMNASLARAGIVPYMPGTEENYIRNLNDDFDHPRSYCCSKLYSDAHHAKISLDMDIAMREAKERISLWKSSSQVD